jgi:hypothetical protein
MRRQVIEIIAIGGERIFAGAPLGCEHVEKQFDQCLVGCSWPAGHRLALSPASVIFEEFVRRNGHDDLAWLIFDEGGKREYGTVSYSDEQAEKDQKSE